MGSYYYLNDPKSDFGSMPVPEDDYIAAILSIAREHGLKITDKMVLEKLGLVKMSPKKATDKRKDRLLKNEI